MRVTARTLRPSANCASTVDGHGALVERPVGRCEDDGVAGRADGAAGEDGRADLVPGRAGLRGRCGEQQGERRCGAASQQQGRTSHRAIPSSMREDYALALPGTTMARSRRNN